ncbi:hypothetical protein FFU37_14325 [Pseudoalteromonas distincta]|uniref:Uncharacterized protein n=1 Tax=Pseudoalteromonas distincta TaxID=77608 RepID=A0A4P9J3N5_9GAMM|nr:hypothetical protein FFU37_14325 [Pseudoalteromonas distincta]|tara:strand:+ start:11945 stop:12124 length:180 start_codon:yes stop_codon:yes gene_type:complete
MSISRYMIFARQGFYYVFGTFRLTAFYCLTNGIIALYVPASLFFIKNYFYTLKTWACIL